jgi:hypothetical protein
MAEKNLNVEPDIQTQLDMQTQLDAVPNNANSVAVYDLHGVLDVTPPVTKSANIDSMSYQMKQMKKLSNKIEKLRLRNEINDVMLRMHYSNASDIAVHQRLKVKETKNNGFFGGLMGDD